MKIKKKILASVIIVNYNNAKFLKKSVNSILDQSYKFIEIIVVDDKSTDKSIQVLKKFKKKIKILKNSENKSKYGSFNQINSYYRGFLVSKGDIIFFLDSDDFYKKRKIEIIIKAFKENINTNLIFDLPILKFKNKNIKKRFTQKKFILSSWPRFSPQSCISGKKNYIKELFSECKIEKFNLIWFDFRIAIYTFLKFGKVKIINNYLTYYRQLDTSASKDFETFSKNWWLRRLEAHKYYSYVCKKLKVNDTFTIDKLITKFVCQIIRK